jgi:hypothetical protein
MDLAFDQRYPMAAGITVITDGAQPPPRHYGAVSVTLDKALGLDRIKVIR